jgi:hypothetical protein
MILNFLQTRKPPILPSLHHMVGNTGETESMKFEDDLERLRGHGRENKESIGQLLFKFFRLYGHEIDYATSVISVRHGRLLSRKEKHWDLRSLSKEGRDRLCVEEPFTIARNLGNSADETAWRGIHLEIRRAFDLLADGQRLDKCCEQYEYPPEEKVTFKRPTPAPKPILSFGQPATRNGRGGSSHRGGRGGGQQQQRTQAYGRRSSSSAALGNGRPQFLPSPLLGVAGPDYLGRSGQNGLNGLNIEQSIMQQYQMLEILQQQTLRAQAMAQSQHLQYQAQAHAQSVAQGRSSSQGSPPKSGPNTGRSSPRVTDAAPVSAPLYPNYVYPSYSPEVEGNATFTSPPPAITDGTRTNPSSPSLTATMPTVRRGAHRTSVTSEAPGASLRSQSQPARGVQSSPLFQQYPPPPAYDPVMLANFQQMTQVSQPRPRQAASAEIPQQPFGAPVAAVRTPLNPDLIPKEYIGYYVDATQPIQSMAFAPSPAPQPKAQATPQPAPQSVAAQPPTGRPYNGNYKLAPIPSWKEISARRQKDSGELSSGNTLLPNGPRKASRSPSPLSGHFRAASHASGLRSATFPPEHPQGRSERVDPTQPFTNGLLIVNGSVPRPSQIDRLTNSTESEERGPTVDQPTTRPQVAQQESQQPQQLYEQKAQEMRRQYGYPNTVAPKGHRSNDNEPHAPSAQTNELTIVSSTSAQSQPFPAYVEYPEYAIGSSSGNANDSLSPKTQEHPSWQNQSNPRPALEIPKSFIGAVGKEPAVSNAPVLSPVIETRTPSPTASRTIDFLGAKAASQHRRTNTALKVTTNGTNVGKDLPSGHSWPPKPPAPGRSSNTPSPASASPASHKMAQPSASASPVTPVDATTKAGQASTGANVAGSIVQNTWTKQGGTKKKSKKKTGHASKPGDGKDQGQPAPANESERKGG